MNTEIRIRVEKPDERIDKLIARTAPEITRSAAQNLIAAGAVTVNGINMVKSAKLRAGDEIVISLPELRPAKALPENIPLAVIYEDEDLLVVNKPKGMVVHPAPGNEAGTLVNALLYHCRGSLSGINGVIRPGIVHRIDKDTSGLLVVAKNDFSHVRLAAQIKQHSFRREYQAVVYGRPKEPKGSVNAPIGRNPKDRKKMAVLEKSAAAREAVTHYEVLRDYQQFSHLGLKLETGRTHQIRVHMSFIGHPVAGDPVYGPKKVITALHGQCLHAGLIGFVHPRTDEYLEYTAVLPDYFTKFLSGLTQR